ncbi:hypothetical protein PO878_00725 [Iamia majanohamensis]|uniref:NYN domain-containing protein n=1 Tax=Iamia majanohamensis TaxID=467976 RepID=A0AAE9Y601_9ACTN|nr:hypothetical protein [Iamia majanohamensis]WCO67245.1 hypothetical protein PO878_00725 [Iamia majanohamensis]
MVSDELAGGGDGARRLLVVDAPNVDRVHAGLLGRPPLRTERFDPEALTAWMDGASKSRAERTLFTNVRQPVPAGVEGWIRHLVDAGWKVFAKPKLRPGDDIDDEMVAHLTSAEWTQVTVFSHDSACFVDPLMALAASGCVVTVLGFRECAGNLPHLDGIDYVDVASVPGLYQSLPPRVRLVDLRPQGSWVEPVAN